MTPLRILLVTSQLPPDIGGTSVHAAEIARALGAQGHAVTVAIRDRDPAEFAGLGLDVRSIDTRRGPWKPLRLRRAQRALLGLARERAADVVYFSYPVVGLGNVYGRLARAGIPYVVNVHGVQARDFADARARARRRRKWGLARASGVICCSRWLAERMAPLLERPAAVVYCGIDPRIAERATEERVAALRRELGLEGRRVLLCLGRFVPRKNFDAVIRLLPEWLAKHDDLVLLLVGGGSEEAAWRALAAEIGVAERVVWAPRVPPLDVGAYYALADVFVSVSRTRPEDDTYETFGLVYAEANLCGTPVVAGREGGVPELVIDGETGLLASGERPREIHAAVARLLDDAALRQRLVDAGRRRAYSFTWERAALDTAALLHAAVRAGGGGSG